jgi:hypothetical protein
MLSFETTSLLCQGNFAAGANSRLKFEKCLQQFIRLHNETLPLSRCASTIQIVCPLESIAEKQPQPPSGFDKIVHDDFPVFHARSVLRLFQVLPRLALLASYFLHPTTTRRQAGCFMLLIVSMSNGLNRNPQPLSARRISITHGTGSVWLTSV